MPLLADRSTRTITPTAPRRRPAPQAPGLPGSNSATFSARQACFHWATFPLASLPYGEHSRQFRATIFRLWPKGGAG